MGILYYPDSVVKKFKSPIDRLQASNAFRVAEGHADLTSDPLAYVFSFPGDSEIHELDIHFGSGSSKDYSIAKLIGRGIITGVNDTLWFKVDGASFQQIILPQGFYTGTELASLIQDTLDDNAAFVSYGASPFSVGYDSGTGLFTIATDAGEIQYAAINPTVPVFRKYSTAGQLIGFTEDMEADNTLVSNTEVYSLGTKNVVLSDTSSSVQDIVSTDIWALDIDQALSIDVSTVSTTIDYRVVYRPL